jgi:hypothetical protein
MIIKGGSRSNGAQLGRYLMEKGENAEVEVLELPASARSVGEAVRDMERMGKATRGEKVLYHAQINPNPGEPMQREDWIRSADILAEKLGMEGQPRVIVYHLKEGYLEGAREHAHVVFQRTDVERGRLISDSHNYRKHEAASRQIERELGHEPVPTVDRGTSYTQEEARKARQLPAPTELVRREGSARVTYVPDGQYGPYRSGRGANPKEVRAFVTMAYQRARGPEEFRVFLRKADLHLSVGERRAFALIDGAGQDYTLARMVQGARTSDLKRFLGPIVEELPQQQEMQEWMQSMTLYNQPNFVPDPEQLSTGRFEPGGDLYRDPSLELENMDPEERAELERVLFGEEELEEEGPEQEIPEQEKSKQESAEAERPARSPEKDATGRDASQESQQAESSREAPEEETSSLDPSREERLKEEIRRRALRILDENTPPEEKRGRSRGQEESSGDLEPGEKPEKDQEKGRDKGRGRKNRGRGRSGGMGLGF